MFEALRFHFTEKHHKFGFTKGEVFRGSRISVLEQRSFVEGQYLWNLGFTSTSRVEKKAYEFLSGIKNEEERVRIRISFSKHTSNYDYLWDQEGFCCIDQISEISEFVIVDEEEVLFNPLNTFQIVKWDKLNRVLYLMYGPQLDILEKKNQGIHLSKGEKELLYSLSKLKNRKYDRGK